MEGKNEGSIVQHIRPKRQWSLKKIVVCFWAVFLVFAAGVAVGRGNLHTGSIKANGERDSLPVQLDYSSINKLYDILKENYDGQLSKDKLLDGLKDGLVSATGDPYTNYFNALEAQEFEEQLSGSFTGIGAELGTDNEGRIVIMSPLSGYPAEKAGLKPRDIIAQVDGQAVTSNMSVDSVVKKIRGAANTKVTLKIVRGNAAPFDVTLTRTKIVIASVESKVEGKIGYIKINQFNSDTVPLAQKAAAQFKARDVKAVVLDLRSNPGGYLSGAVGIASLWLNKGDTVVSERRGGQVQNIDYANETNTLKGVPTVVLINGGSASASEIVAGALHDNKVATLVGTKTFGKGSVQQVIELGDGSELKVTTAHWYTPDGKNIDKQGIAPDTKVENGENTSKSGKDAQKDKAYQILQAKL